MFDVFDKASVAVKEVNISEKMTDLGKSFESSIKSVDGVYKSSELSPENGFANWLSIEESALAGMKTTDYMAVTNRMLNGAETEVGRTLGLKEINGWKVNPEYKTQNLKQHAGYAAEVIGTAKENMLADIEGTGVKVSRADDRPDMFPKNDQYVDKIREYPDGRIEKIQVKFVGKNGNECLDKLMSKKYDKYFEEGKVDKIEISKENYKEIMGDNGKLINERINDYQKQLDRVKADGKTEVAEGIQNKIDKLNDLKNGKLEESKVSQAEAEYAVKHPERYAAKCYAKDIVRAGDKAGRSSAKVAASVTFAVSTVENVQSVIDGEKTTEEAVVDVAKDTVVSGAAAYGVGFVSGAASSAMAASSNQMIRSMGNAGVPGVVVAFAVDSYDSVSDYAQGIIDEKQLAYDLGESASGVAGSVVGSAVAGAVVGSVVPGAGTVVGAAAGLAGGMVGYAVATEAYATAVEIGTENADVIAETAEKYANQTIEIAQEVIPDGVDTLKGSMADFGSKANLPFSIG